MSGVDGRFAPSPSGPLHLGNLRTALVAWLFARSQAARFLVRIEDLDPQRSRREHEAGQLADLTALGLDWDGPVVRQSERRTAHEQALERLREQGQVYPCWCSRAEIRAAASAPHGKPLEGAYPGTCRALSARQRAQRKREGRAPAWRLNAGGRTVDFDDRVHGRVARPVDDFVVWRGDGTPAYNLAVVVDDDAQGVGEVVRGEDLLETTPRQVLIARLLGLAPPTYAHVPLVLGPDGARLAKRHGAVTLSQRLGLGETIEEIVGWMAWTLGLVARGTRLTASELRDRFDPAAMTAGPATVLDPTPVG
jgi:glutamyl-tRNA synthetase